jgi:AcrR family transcriptional regulator
LTTAIATRPGGRTARVRRAVFEAALDLLARDGFQSLTIDAIAAKAGVNKTTIYRNWPTKAELILAAAEDRSEAMITTESTGNAERDLITFVKSVVDSITSPLGRALVIASINASDDPEVREAKGAFWRHRFEATRDFVREAIRGAGLDEGSDVDLFIERLVGPLYLRVFITGAPVDDRFIRRTVSAALRLGP